MSSVSAYLSAVSSALALTASRSPKSPTISKLVLFDSGLSQLRLPILPLLSFGDTGENEPRRGTLSVLLERYFEWRVEFPDDQENESGDVQDDESKEKDLLETKDLRLSRLTGRRAENDEEEGVVWTWGESVQVGDDGRRWTNFLWDDF
ncbi:hypothetical protein BD309DRAFT_25052 [Dichomitus squalens]|nr:hypothetical protein BD309DRAFT_25052 [Dichomitus squalens]